MKGVNESVFLSGIRAFLVGLFGLLGVFVAIFIAIMTISGIISITEDETLPSKVKILPDAHGNRKKLSMSTPILLQIEITGTIGKEKLTADKIEEILLDSRDDGFKDDRVRGILLMINSPGGAATDSDMIYRYIKAYKETYKVPVYAYIDGICASGGYYIACAADKVYASDVSLVGSIGVLSWPPFLNFSDTLKKLGIDTLTLSAGKGKDELNPFRPWEKGEQDHYQSIINYFYQQFVGIVSSSRSLPKEDVVKILGAEVFPAPNAQKLGLIDQGNASRSEAVSALAKAAGVEDKYQVVGFEAKSWWKKALKEQPQSPLFTGRITHELSLPGQMGHPVQYLYSP